MFLYFSHTFQFVLQDMCYIQNDNIQKSLQLFLFDFYLDIYDNDKPFPLISPHFLIYTSLFILLCMSIHPMTKVTCVLDISNKLLLCICTGGMPTFQNRPAVNTCAFFYSSGTYAYQHSSRSLSYRLDWCGFEPHNA